MLTHFLNPVISLALLFQFNFGAIRERDKWRAAISGGFGVSVSELLRGVDADTGSKANADPTMS